MKQIYYVIQTLLRGRGSNIIKVLSLGLALTMSILLFVRVVFEQSYDTCYRDPDRIYQLFSIFTINGEQGEPGELNLPPVAGASWRTFPKKWKRLSVFANTWLLDRFIMVVYVLRITL